MNSKNVTILLCLMILAQFGFSQVSEDRLHYIDKYKVIAQEEMERTGVPASIKLAQAILESNGGKSVLSRKANNHFGIKCGSNWNARSFYRVDDDKDQHGNAIESCFRVYKNPESSFIAHSEFLRDNRRYEFLFDLEHNDFKGWAHGLKKAGYATNPKYPTLLIKIINDYDLYQYDELFLPAPPPGPAMASNDDNVMMEEILKAEGQQNNRKVVNKTAKTSKLNDISVVYAKQDETPETIAIKTDVSLKRLLKYNETLTEPNQIIPEKTVVFLQPKRKAFRGRKKFHKIKDGESLVYVSQKYGIQVSQLQKRNRLAVNEEPLEGAILKIRGSRVAKNSQIPTREIYVAGYESKEDSKVSASKYATSLSDFEAPPTMEERKANAAKNKKRLFNFGKNKKVQTEESVSLPSDSYKASPTYTETSTSEQERTSTYQAPIENEVTSSGAFVPSTPSTSAPSASAPSTSIPSASIPSTSAPSSSISNTSIPNTGVSNTSISSTSAPVTSDIYQTETTSPNASFKEYSGQEISSNHTSSEPYSKANSTVTSNSNNSSEIKIISSPNTSSTYNTSTSTGTYTTAPEVSSSVSTYSSAPASTHNGSVVSAPQSVIAQYHTVAKGETLYRLSKTYNKSVDYIKQVNNLNSNTISIGQKLIVN